MVETKLKDRKITSWKAFHIRYTMTNKFTYVKNAIFVIYEISYTLHSKMALLRLTSQQMTISSHLNLLECMYIEKCIRVLVEKQI